jgi:sodium-dependent dicarboxylate transporter 2/3/5
MNTLIESAGCMADVPVTAPGSRGPRQWIGWVLGPALMIVTVLTAPPEGLGEAGWRTAGAAALMVVWWVCETMPVAATGLLPLAVFPLLGVAGGREVAEPYAHPIIFLFLGGFLIALAMQRWNLHRRVALGIIGALGTRPARLVGGFLLTSALVSMWVSNTATALMMAPIALSVSGLASETTRAEPSHRAFAAALFLAVAYGATAGGMATLIGTPPNALFAAYVEKIHGVRIGFGQWMLIGVPAMIVVLALVYLVLTRFAFRLDRSPVEGMAALLAAERAQLGPVSRGEVVVAAVFALTAAGWVAEPWLAAKVPGVSDTLIAMAGALALFCIPAGGRRGERVLNWATAREAPWDVLLLFGGGLSLAAAIERNGLSRYLGELCRNLDGMPVMLTLALVCLGILVIGELTSNTATAAMFLPIAGALALSLGQNPLLFLVPAVLAANCSFVLPVGTPPNAIVFGSGRIALPQMVKAGLWLDALLLPLMLGLMLLLGGWVFGVHLNEIPAWALRP